MQQSATVYPGPHWQQAATPAAVGWSADLLAEARAFSETIGSAAVMIVQGGMVVDAWGDIARKFLCHSIRKSVLSALIGVAVHTGNMELSKTLAALAIDDTEPALTPNEKHATVADLLTARSGIYHPASVETAEMSATRPLRGSHTPGTFWHYNNWDFNALGAIFEQETGTRIYDAFQQHLAGPLHMEDYDITDFAYTGGPASLYPAYVFRLSTRDLARFGLLFLREGRWEEAQPLPATWVRDSTASHAEIGPHSGYGYMWWTGTRQGLFPHITVKGHCYYAAGYRGHYVIVLPYKDLVVVHRVNTDVPEGRVTEGQVGWLLRLILAASGEVELGQEAPAPEVQEGLRSVCLPHDVTIVPPQSSMPVERAAFSGQWAGLWEGVVPHILVVEQITPDSAVAVFAWGMARRWNIHQGRWTRVPARFVDGTLQLKLQRPATVTYRLQPDGTLSATYEGAWDWGRATMRRMR
jgi:CubicO group peptidase (beta-lactamase class C family)